MDCAEPTRTMGVSGAEIMSGLDVNYHYTKIWIGAAGMKNHVLRTVEITSLGFEFPQIGSYKFKR